MHLLTAKVRATIFSGLAIFLNSLGGSYLETLTWRSIFNCP